MTEHSSDGLRGDVSRLFSDRGTHEGRPSLLRALERVATRPGPLAVTLYRASHWLWRRGMETAAEVVWRINYFLTGADIHPGAEIGGGLKLTHTSGVVIGRGVKIGRGVTLLHGVTLGGSARGWFDGTFADGFPEIGDETEIMAGAKVRGPNTGGAITHWNRFAVDLFGHAPEEALGRDFLDLVVDPSDRQAIDGIVECLGTGESWQGEVLMRGRDGAPILTRVRASVTRDSDGRRLGLAAVIVDIGELKRSEIRLGAQYAVSRVLSEAETL